MTNISETFCNYLSVGSYNNHNERQKTLLDTYFFFLESWAKPIQVESFYYFHVTVVQSLSRVWLFVTPWFAAHQASLSITISWSLFKLMSTESVMPSNHFILCRPLLLLPSIFLRIRVFSSVTQFFPSGGQSIGASASAPVLPVNIQVDFH